MTPHAYSYSPSPRADSAPPSQRQLIQATLFSLFVIASPAAAFGAGITVTGPGQIAFPSVTVTAYPESVYSGEYTLELFNRNEKNGWLLTGEVSEGHLLGSASGTSVPAELIFKSITWISGGQGSSAGIIIAADGKRIEADPGFGIGKYVIAFEIRFDVPAFPTADQYHGVSTFIVQ